MEAAFLRADGISEGANALAAATRAMKRMAVYEEVIVVVECQICCFCGSTLDFVDMEFSVADGERGRILLMTCDCDNETCRAE